MKKYFILACVLLSNIHISHAQYDYNWYYRESDNFKVIYRDSHAFLVSHILNSAENSLRSLTKLLNYIPSEKIVINTYDFSDYGSAGTTTVPHNFIRLEIAPFELGYETMPFNERLQWIISHELVHIAINDQATMFENYSRKVFSKVPPEKNQPITVFYSLLTNFSRYTPRWHQEGIAVFFETWLSGGYGRMLSNFDEMYFRALVSENKFFPSPLRLDGKDTQTSHFLDMLFYFYGARYVSFLAANYDIKKILNWFIVGENDFYTNFEEKFKKTYGFDLKTAWKNFILFEKNFQKKNLKRLLSTPLTPVKKLQNRPLGWVTQPHYDPQKKTVLFGSHQSHKLTAINELNLATRGLKKIGSIPSPSIIGVSSTAYDSENGRFFYTTNNNKLFRDIWIVYPASSEKKQLFEDVRVGQLTHCAETGDLWGVQHSAGKAAIVYSPYPYRDIIPTVQFDIGDDLQHLAVSPDGRFLAATLHRASGTQIIIKTNLEQLKNSNQFLYQLISEEGAPEFPSWSPDGNLLYWNAYTNGVSNIYSYDFRSEKIVPLSHTDIGLFKPIYLSSDTLFAFEFSSDGFLPVLLPNRPAQHLPAIEYLGQKIVDKNPKVTQWALKPVLNSEKNIADETEAGKNYSAFSFLQVHSFIPIITGFQNQKVLGFYTHLADPLFIHDLTFEIGYSPFRTNSVTPKIHFKGKYEFKREYSIGVNVNATDFYDLFNKRKRGMIGTKITLGNNHFWKYDNPHKIKQSSQIALYTGIEAINDNLVVVYQPDFLILQTALNSTNTRRSIGSTDKEAGSIWETTVMVFGADPNDPQIVGGLHIEWDSFTTLRWPHNIIHLKLAAGIRNTNDQLAIGKFYFGGFGNRQLENSNPKQFRNVFYFPGIPIYSLAAKQFAKILIENNLPPLRLAWPLLGFHYISYIDASWYSQGLMVDSQQEKYWLDLGGQINIVLKHWHNLESTFSAGIAKAWSANGSNWEWFVSYKILR